MFAVSFSDREVRAWGGLALVKLMLERLGFREAVAGWGLPEPGSNQGYAPLRLIEQFIVLIWCGACRFAHAETARMDSTLVRLFDWSMAAGHKAIMRLFGRFNILTNERVQAEANRWFFGKIGAQKQVTLDVDSTVIPRNGAQEGAARGDNPGRHGRASHHLLLALVDEPRMVVSFWSRPDNAHSGNNSLQLLELTLYHLGAKRVGLLRADSVFFDETILAVMEGKRIPYIVAARLKQPLQRAIYQASDWWSLETRLVLTELRYQAAGWDTGRRLIVVRQSVRRKTAPGQDAGAVCRRSGQSGLPLWRRRGQSWPADEGGSTYLTGTC